MPIDYRPHVSKRSAWAGIDPGRLNSQIQIATQNVSQDGYGQPLTAWNVYLTTWAEIRLLAGREMYQTGEFSSDVQYKITLRYPSPGITVHVGDRIFSGNDVYVVEVINDISTREVLMELNCLQINGSS